MKVLIIEDEAPAFRRLQKILDDLDEDLDILEVLDSVESSIRYLQTHEQPDLIFMDIQLADGHSFEIFKEVQVNVPLIFTTAFDEYTLKAFQVNSIDYLLKPLKIDDVKKSLTKLKNLRSVFASEQQDYMEILKAIQDTGKAYKKRFLIKFGDRLISTAIEEVAYFFTKDGLVFLVNHKGRKYHIDYTMDDLEVILDPERFYRVNRQYCISYHSIKATNKYFNGKLLVELIPETDNEVVISREKAMDFKKWLDA